MSAVVFDEGGGKKQSLVSWSTSLSGKQFKAIWIPLVPYGFVVWIAIGISNTSQVEYLKKEVRRRTGQK